jgi:hypothetical protein
MAPDQQNLKVPPEQEHLNRQLEALGRYVADLQQQREGAKEAAASHRRYLSRGGSPGAGCC